MNPDDAMKRISQLEEALMLMVYQYCVTDDRLEHRYMCAGEHAFAAFPEANAGAYVKPSEKPKVEVKVADEDDEEEEDWRKYL